LRLCLLGKLGWRGLFSFNQQRALLKDVFRGLFLVPFYGTKLRESRLVHMLISSSRLGIAGKDSGSTAHRLESYGYGRSFTDDDT
jgi:hypothetical protein